MISYNRFKHTTYFTGPGWLKAYHQYGVVFVNHKEGGTRPQPQVIKFASCLPMVGGSLWVLRVPPPLKLVVMI